MHESARGGECVDPIGIEDDEYPGQVGPLGLLGDHGPDKGDVLVNGGVLHDTETCAELHTDLCTDPLLLLVTDVQRVELLLLLLYLLSLLEKTTELSVTRTAKRQRHQDKKGPLHRRPSPFEADAGFVRALRAGAAVVNSTRPATS